MSQFNYIGSGAPAFGGPSASPALYFDRANNTQYTWDGVTGLWRASGLVTPPQDSIVAAGTTQGTATVLQTGIGLYNVITTPAGTGVILPVSQAGQETVLANNGANALLVYPFTGEKINALAINAGFSVATSTVIVFYCFTKGQIYTK